MAAITFESETVALIKRDAPPCSFGAGEIIACIPTRPIAGFSPFSTRSRRTTDTARKLSDLERAVVDGLMAAPEADRVYGRQQSGAGGRPRAAGREDFASWLRGRIAKLSDPEALGRFAEQMARVRQDRTLSHGKRIAIVREINRQSWQHDPAYIELLRAALAELDEAAEAREAPSRAHDRAEALRVRLAALRPAAA
jgi:hypothetical protein